MNKLLILPLFAMILVAGCVSSNNVNNTTQNNTTPVINNTTPPAINNTTSIPAEAVATTNVEIRNNAFIPQIIVVKKGATVRWVNRDYILHIVKFSNTQSPALERGDVWSYSFRDVGTFEYRSSISPSINGTVIVTE
jgi:plastocyanin